VVVGRKRVGIARHGGFDQCTEVGEAADVRDGPGPVAARVSDHERNV